MRLLFLIILLSFSVTPNEVFAQKITVHFSGYSIDPSAKKDASMLTFLSGYRDSVTKSMGAVIGFSTTGLSKHQPESGLGNFMTDALKTVGEQVFGKHIDAAFVNYGGVRSYLPKGNITIGTIFELMPFDNALVLQSVKGDSLLSLLNHIAAKNGWPVSGITMAIKEKKAVNIMVDGRPLSTDSIYTIANSDYIANGGDDTNMLKVFPQQKKGYLIRDALIAYVKKQTEQGKPIDAKIEKRITYAE